MPVVAYLATIFPLKPMRWILARTWLCKEVHVAWHLLVSHQLPSVTRGRPMFKMECLSQGSWKSPGQDESRLPVKAGTTVAHPENQGVATVASVQLVFHSGNDYCWSSTHEVMKLSVLSVRFSIVQKWPRRHGIGVEGVQQSLE